MEAQRIIMNYTTPPSVEDFEALSSNILQSIPDELSRHCDGIGIIVEDMVDEAIQADLNLDDPFDILALYKSGKAISPGIEKKVAEADDVLVLYRRSLLDMWCETEDDLQLLIRQVIIEELGRYFEFSEEDIQEMSDRHYQGML